MTLVTWKLAEAI